MGHAFSTALPLIPLPLDLMDENDFRAFPLPSSVPTCSDQEAARGIYHYLTNSACTPALSNSVERPHSRIDETMPP